MASKRAVRVTWEDAFIPEDVWYEDGGVTYEPRLMSTVGYCVLQDKHYLAIASTYDEDGDKYCGVILIPRGCITKIADVEELDRLPDDSDVDGVGADLSADGHP